MIVNEPRLEVLVTNEGKEVEFWVYLADDPLDGRTVVYVPQEGEYLSNPNEFQVINILAYGETKIDDYFQFNGISIKFTRPDAVDKRMITDRQALGVKPNEEDIGVILTGVGIR